MATTKSKSKYATKRESGKQLYGPGCCGHSITPQRGEAIRRANGTFGRSGDQQ